MIEIARTLHAPPRASAMLESLRGLGYSTATALADIIDNSISAGASLIKLDFVWQGTDSHVTILDDGHGMDANELERAMRLGDRNPRDDRAQNDLGRFGLGLKTASFSQCRRLTVASKRDRVNVLRWDLDLIAMSAGDGWYLHVGPSDGSEALLDPLESLPHGTLVLWQNLDRIVTAGFDSQDFLDLVDGVERHLAMVFHRYLEGNKPLIRILLNGRAIEPWDPFLRAHSATWSSPVERIGSGQDQVEIQCHVLPHQDRLDQRELELASGPEGWTAQQGFYVYRNKRLLVAGGWLGLGHGKAWTREEAHRLARIRVDISNNADRDWKIDIRKAVARPPVNLRSRLLLLAEDTRERARKVFAYRGQVTRGPGQAAIEEVWKATQTKGGTRYRISVEHPAVAAVLSQAGDMESQVRAMLRVIEETIPVQRVWLDTAEGKEVPRTGFAGVASPEVRSVLEIMYRNMILRKNISPAMARTRLKNTEPFHHYPELVDSLPDQP